MHAGRRASSRLDGTLPTPSGGFGGGRGAVGYRSLLGEPGEGVPVEGRAGGARTRLAIRPVLRHRAGAHVAPLPPHLRARRRACPAGGTRRAGGRAHSWRAARGRRRRRPFGFLFRPSGVGYVVSSDGMLHVLGLPSGKDMQRPAPFLPANSRWSAPIAVGTTMYAATSGGCGGAPSGVWAIDLDSEAKPVVSWKTNGGDVVGAVAFTQDGTLIAAIGRGQGDRRRQGERDRRARREDAAAEGLVHAADSGVRDRTDDPPSRRQGNRRRGDARTAASCCSTPQSLGGAEPRHAACSSRRPCSAPARRSALTRWPRGRSPALRSWRRRGRACSTRAPDGTPWILVPVAGRIAAGAPATNGAVSNGAVVALKLTGAGGALVAGAWMGVARPRVARDADHRQRRGVRAGDRSAGGAGRDAARAAVLHAYDGATGKRLWESGKAMTTPRHRAASGAGSGRSTSGRTTARSTRSASTTSGARSRRLGRSNGKVHHRRQFTPAR